MNFGMTAVLSVLTRAWLSLYQRDNSFDEDFTLNVTDNFLTFSEKILRDYEKGNVLEVDYVQPASLALLNAIKISNSIYFEAAAQY